MGPVFVILFWGILAIVYTAIVVVLATLAILGWRKKHVWLAWLAGVPAAGMTAIGAISIFVIVVLFGTSLVVKSNPRAVYYMTFGEKPDPSVTNIQAESGGMFDSEHVYLKFQVSPDKFRSLIPADLQAVDSDRLDRYHFGNTDSDWWDIQLTNPEWQYYLRERGHDDPAESKMGFSYEWELMAYNPHTQTAYYQYLGID